MENKLQHAAEVARSLFADLGLSEFHLRDGDFELNLKKPTPTVVQATAPAQGSTVAVPASAAVEAAPAPAVVTAAASRGREVKSPLVGVLYLAPAPGAKPFVSVGDRVSAGDVLCIVEAMKMMNELTAEYDGTVLEICADNEALVEYGQVLFRIG
ncbi:MAG: acetyl-CoA carboxylase biotin carboxyl carrier protein [Clostridia bacterium]|nr:acetyl-CoA carboxylase biotin carboxyl carrier protein [Clostridia bacterium]